MTGVVVSSWEPADPGSVAAVTALLSRYHRRTEEEKGAAVDTVEALPARYRAEIADPVGRFADATVLLARSGDSADRGRPLGMVVLARWTDSDGSPAAGGWWEVKRLWVEPAARGRGVGRALLDEAVDRAAAAGGGLRLSVWEWRTDALRLYERAGLGVVPSWDERPGLVCLQRPAPAVAPAPTAAPAPAPPPGYS